MSQNNPLGGSTPGQGTGGAGTGATDAGTTRDTGAGSSQSIATGSGGGQSAGAGTATGLAQTAQEYGQKIADAASTAREYVTDKVSVVGDKIGELRNKDFSEVASDAKEFARQNPGQALLISAAAGFVLGLLIRGSRR
ncbi:MAG TPA: hypothetical protein VGC66_20600 [Pyrinomonadaceae bacterium]|jgi:ElaB/YqjD/DUF883 family membrane-anchored ribosome-binding protein